jgi:hypothetical protein
MVDFIADLRSWGGNAERLIKAKRTYDSENIFSSAIPLPVVRGSEVSGRTAITPTRHSSPVPKRREVAFGQASNALILSRK